MSVTYSRTAQGLLVAEVTESAMAAATSSTIRDHILGTMNPGEPLIIDLSSIDFLDSSGLGGLVSILKLAGGDEKVAIVTNHPSVRKLFRLTRMDRVFRMMDHRSEIEAFRF